MTLAAQPPQTQIAEATIDRYFDLFRPTVELAEDLIRTRAKAQELVLLLCARLDALASCLAREDQSNRLSFVQLLLRYAGDRELMESVSAGDLYYELGFHRWLMEGMIPKPGRLVRFSRLDDPIIALLDRSRIPLTVEAASHLLTRIMRVVAANYRCRPGQPKKKPMTAKPQAIITELQDEFRRAQDAEIREAISLAMRPLLDDMTMAGLLYAKFRNNAVHGIKVEFDERSFFRATRPYWEPLYSEYYPPFFMVKFPAPYLLQLLRNCMNMLKRKLVANGKLPPDIHFHVFGYGLDETRFLDHELLPTPRPLNLHMK